MEKNTLKKSRGFILISASILAAVVQPRAEEYSEKKLALKTVDYKLNFRLDYENEKLFCEGEMTVMNPSPEPVNRIPLLLYRLLKLMSVTNKEGTDIPFEQRIVSFTDWEQLQVNFIEIFPKDQIEKNETFTLRFKYDGYLAGYTEAMRYVKDRIDEEYTVLRMETYVYPVVGYPSWRVNRTAIFQKFDYLIRVTVPSELVVANGGVLVDKNFHDGLVTFSYRNIKPAWRIDAAISKYALFESGKNRIFYFPEDSLGAQRAMNALTKTLDLFTEWFGPLADYQGFSIIEVPNGYGSQADVTTILQTADAFGDPENLYGLYHEISHQWNVEPLDPAPPRFESEGLAMLLQHLVQEELENKTDAAKKGAQRCAERVRKAFEKNPEYRDVPMMDYGEEDMTDLSYTKGMVMFYTLYKIVGEEQFKELIGSFYQEYHTRGATADEFVEHCRRKSRVDLTDIFNDWVYGIESSEYILDGFSVEDIINKYRKN